MGTILEYFVYDPEGGCMVRQRMRLNRYMARFKTKREQQAEAQRICDDVNRRLAGGWSPLAEGGSAKLLTSVKDLRAKWLSAKKREGLRDATLQSYSSMTSLFVDWCEATGKGKRCGYFTKEDAVDYMDYVLDKGNSTRNWNNTMKQLRGFWSWALEHCYCKENPFASFKPMPKTKKKRILIDADTRTRIKEYYMERCPQMYLVCLLVYSSLLRPKEIANITMADIDLRRRCIVVRDEVAKNGKARCAALTQETIDMIRPQLTGRKEEYLFGKGETMAPNKQRVALSTFRHKWDRVREVLQLPQEMQLYSFRDTGITDLLHAGVDQLSVQHHADHSSLDVQGIYTDHFDPGLNDTIYHKAPRF